MGFGKSQVKELLQGCVSLSHNAYGVSRNPAFIIMTGGFSPMTRIPATRKAKRIRPRGGVAVRATGKRVTKSDSTTRPCTAESLL